MSLRFERAMQEWRECREAYELHLEAAYAEAVEGTQGSLLNDRGARAGIRAESLFMGPQVRAFAYASAELREWWETHPRVTFADFEAGWPYPSDEDEVVDTMEFSY